LGYELGWAHWPKEAHVRWDPDPNAKGQFLGERTCPGVPDNTVVSCAKTAELIKIAFGLWAQVGSRNIILMGGPDTPCEGAVFRELVCPTILCHEPSKNG